MSGSAKLARVQTEPACGHCRNASTAMALLALFALPLHAQNLQHGRDRVETVTSPSVHAAYERSPFRPRRAGASRQPHSISIGRISQEQSSAEMGAAARPGIPRKIGFGRDIAELARSQDTVSRLQWHNTPDGGMIGALSVTSPPATGLRLGVLVHRMPTNAVLRFYRQDSDSAYEISGAEILASLKRNFDAGDASDEARTFWSPYFEGEQITLEVELPLGISPDALEFAVPRVSHFVSPPLAASRANLEKIGQSASCEVDVSCNSAWNYESNATAMMLFVQSGSSYECSGTLLNSRAADFTPYFLSANHCISSQTVASTLETRWFYRSASCNSGVLSADYQRLAGGARLLYASPVTDTSFMKLNSTPPSGTSYAGWLGSPPTPGTPVADIHHPRGDLQKISSGNLQAYRDCTDTVLGSFSCAAATQASGEFLNVTFTSGTTEGGSSGSGLFAIIGGNHYLIGQLRGGDSSCTNQGGTNIFGRFDLAYSTALYQWLDAGLSYTLTITSSGGTVTGTAGGQSISCTNGSGTCSASGLVGGAAVNLTATPATGNAFSGWSGGSCSGTRACTFTIGTAGVSVIATFTPATPTCTLTAAPASIAAGGTSTLTASCSPLATSYTWTGGTCVGTNSLASCTVTPVETTNYAVAGTNSTGTGPAANATVTVISPFASTITGVAQNYGSATISFTTPSNGGSPITNYAVTCTADGQTTRTGSGTSSPITVQGLTGGVPYSCTVTASNSVATSAPSVAVPVITNSVVPMMMQLLFD